MNLPEMTQRFTPDAKHLEHTYIPHCLLCRHTFEHGDTRHIGYLSDGRAIQVGDCCAHFLVETAVRYIVAKRVFETPPGTTPLWRYMDFSKYVAMLASQTLFFSRLDQFQDPFEGAMGSEDTEGAWCNHYLSFFRTATRNPPEGYVCNLSDQEIEQEAERLLRDFREGNRRKSRMTFVNCWYESEHESDAMWRLYSDQSKYAVAIQSTVGLLRKYTEVQITVGRVRYIDYCKEFPDISFPHFFKRKGFEHEREVRAVIIDPHADQDIVGKAVDITPQALILGVKVSPLCPPWFLEIVQDVTRPYELNVDTAVSSLTKRSFR
jgi:hypothetical protein